MCVISPCSVSEVLHFQQKLDETTKLLRDLQEAQRERLSAKQPPNMICLLAPTAKELELGKSFSVQGPPLFLRSDLATSCTPLTALLLPLKYSSYTGVVCHPALDRDLQLDVDHLQITESPFPTDTRLF